MYIDFFFSVHKVRGMFAVPSFLVSGRHAAAHAVLGTTVHRDDELGGDGENADQRACARQEALTDPRVRRVLRRCWCATYRPQYQRHYYSGERYFVPMSFAYATCTRNRTYSSAIQKTP